MENLYNRKRYRLLTAGLAIYLVIFVYGFLFLHQTGVNNRILNEVWDLSHIIAYAILLMFVIRLSRTYASLTLILQFILAAAFAFVLGMLIEFLQLYTGRTYSLHDVLLNVVGAVTAVALLSPKIKTISRLTARLIQLAVILVLMLVLKNTIIFSYDNYLAHREFPVLFDLSGPFELTRWRGQMVRYDEDVYEAGKVLRAEFLPARYATLIFDYFPRDWTGFKQIDMVIFNPEQTDLKLYIRIHDLEHHEGISPYSDRYNSKLILKPGWNTSSILLEDVRLSPRKRQMDMRHIHQLMLYFPNLEAEKTLLIRQIRLAN